MKRWWNDVVWKKEDGQVGKCPLNYKETWMSGKFLDLRVSLSLSHSLCLSSITLFSLFRFQITSTLFASLTLSLKSVWWHEWIWLLGFVSSLLSSLCLHLIIFYDGEEERNNTVPEKSELHPNHPLFLFLPSFSSSSPIHFLLPLESPSKGKVPNLITANKA